MKSAGLCRSSSHRIESEWIRCRDRSERFYISRWRGRPWSGSCCRCCRAASGIVPSWLSDTCAASCGTRRSRTAGAWCASCSPPAASRSRRPRRPSPSTCSSSRWVVCRGVAEWRTLRPLDDRTAECSRICRSARWCASVWRHTCTCCGRSRRVGPHHEIWCSQLTVLASEPPEIL